MSIRIRAAIVAGVFLGLAAVPLARAADAPSSERVDEFEQKEEGDDSASQNEAESNEPEPMPVEKPRGRSRAKEAEGSKAPNRFQADVVTKSSYKLGGESLEVDPD